MVQDRAKVSGKEVASKSDSTDSASKSAGSSEQIVLSSKAKDIQKAHEIIRSTPDIRVDKVNKIKQDLAEGRYNVKSQDIADRILKQVLADSKFLG
ncbi:MAG: flagellar biosynthesis anti-sigma factor FlgM [Nitrospinae bacterium RIFCSPLOWO2_12_FULL_47_7]|nr:MAG: flagellar biosynthesis anti-sigma factor FlgM [Nitrospinae bacterium RIFCSPLOWO2_12_FULL_47_7]